MNAFLWSAAKPIAFTAALVAMVLVLTRPGVRRAVWSLRAALARNTPAWSGTSDDVFTPAGWDRNAEDTTPVIDGTEAIARTFASMPIGHPESLTAPLDDADEECLAEISGELWPEEAQ